MTHADVEDALKVDRAEWETELAGIEEWYAKFGDSLPEAPAVGARGPEGPLGSPLACQH